MPNWHDEVTLFTSNVSESTGNAVYLDTDNGADKSLLDSFGTLLPVLVTQYEKGNKPIEDLLFTRTAHKSPPLLSDCRLDTGSCTIYASIPNSDENEAHDTMEVYLEQNAATAHSTVYNNPQSELSVKFKNRPLSTEFNEHPIPLIRRLGSHSFKGGALYSVINISDRMTHLSDSNVVELQTMLQVSSPSCSQAKRDSVVDRGAKFIVAHWRCDGSPNLHIPLHKSCSAAYVLRLGSQGSLPQPLARKELHIIAHIIATSIHVYNDASSACEHFLAGRHTNCMGLKHPSLYYVPKDVPSHFLQLLLRLANLTFKDPLLAPDVPTDFFQDMFSSYEVDNSLLTSLASRLDQACKSKTPLQLLLVTLWSVLSAGHGLADCRAVLLGFIGGVLNMEITPSNQVVVEPGWLCQLGEGLLQLSQGESKELQSILHMLNNGDQAGLIMCCSILANLASHAIVRRTKLQTTCTPSHGSLNSTPLELLVASQVPDMLPLHKQVKQILDRLTLGESFKTALLEWLVALSITEVEELYSAYTCSPVHHKDNSLGLASEQAQKMQRCLCAHWTDTIVKYLKANITGERDSLECTMKLLDELSKEDLPPECRVTWIMPLQRIGLGTPKWTLPIYLSSGLLPGGIVSPCVERVSFLHQVSSMDSALGGVCHLVEKLGEEGYTVIAKTRRSLGGSAVV